MQDISRLEDMNEKLEAENHRLRKLTDQLNEAIEPLIAQSQRQKELILKQRAVINELEKERKQWMSAK